MSDLAIEPLQLRAWVYERLRQGNTGSQELQLNDVALHVRGRAVTAGIIPQQPFVANYDIPSFISDPVRGIIWELIIQGIVVPGVAQDHPMHLQDRCPPHPAPIPSICVLASLLASP